MAMQLDHIFICTAPGAPEADALRAFGLTEGPPNRHPGQGTANRRFFFRRSFIELIYVENEDELRSAQTRPTKLYERLTRSSPDVSPFGIGLRPHPGADGSVPFSSWPYIPDYLPDGRSIPIGHAPVSEPMWFVLPYATRPDRTPQHSPHPVNHARGITRITAVRVSVSGDASWSEPARYVNKHVAGVHAVKGPEAICHVTFDRAQANETHDFRPTLPLVVAW
jgi:hypothetical protein